jgi:hypothetical protein
MAKIYRLLSGLIQGSKGRSWELYLDTKERVYLRRMRVIQTEDI